MAVAAGGDHHAKLQKTIRQKDCRNGNVVADACGRHCEDTGRQEFIDRCLDDETEAITHEIQIVREMLAAGIEVPEEELNWY